MIELMLILNAAIWIVVSGCCSGLETGIYVLSPLKLRVGIEEKDKRAMRLQGLFVRRQSLVIMLLAGTNIATFLTTAYFTKLVEQSTDIQSVLWKALLTTLIAEPFILVFAEMLPKNLFLKKSDRLIFSFASLLAAGWYLFYPFTYLFGLVGRVLTGRRWRQRTLFGSAMRRAEFRYYLMEGSEGGLLSQGQFDIIENIMRLSQTGLRDVMIPISEVVMLESSITTEDVLKIAKEKRFSRIPVYEGERENITGVLNIFDLFYEGSAPIREKIRPVKQFEADESISEAFIEMQRGRSPVAVVTHNSRPVGMVTIKDLLEQILGELSDW